MPRGQIEAPKTKPTSRKSTKGDARHADRTFYRGRRIHESEGPDETSA